ncbi:unnamed protein product, partial [Staurois parvus]
MIKCRVVSKMSLLISLLTTCEKSVNDQTPLRNFCASCDWSQLVTWYKAVVNSLVQCDLCDHSQ